MRWWRWWPQHRGWHLITAVKRLCGYRHSPSLHTFKYKYLNNIVSVYIDILYECPHFWLNTMFCYYCKSVVNVDVDGRDCRCTQCFSCVCQRGFIWINWFKSVICVLHWIQALHTGSHSDCLRDLSASKRICSSKITLRCVSTLIRVDKWSVWRFKLVVLFHSAFSE